MRSEFPGCSLFEINLFAYLHSTDNKRDKLVARPGHCFQISTSVHNEADDRWPDLNDGNHVFTGDPGQNRQYPLWKPEKGDVVLVRCGERKGRGIAVVYRNDYRGGEWVENRRLHVLWLNKMSASLGESAPLTGFSEADPAILNAFRNADAYAPTLELLERLSPAPPAETEQSSAAPLVEHPFNRILYGPPGTGKTWYAVNHALAIVDGTEIDTRIERKRFSELRFDPKQGTGQIATVTFHQNFAYEDFIEGIRPSLDGDGVAYKMRHGIFRSIVTAAKEQPSQRFVLIIDEINRGNIAKIFGELITLIEDSRRIGRDDETFVTLPNSGDMFAVPDNLYLIGTMNTADRSIQLLDTALRRRFTFFEMMPRHEDVPTNINGVDCTKLLEAINGRISALLDRERQIGHTYLLNIRNMNQLAEAFRNRIFPLLQEYFFDDWAKIRAVLANNAFVSPREVQDSRALSEFLDEDRKLYEPLPEDDSGWRDATQYRRIYEASDGDEPEDS